jgi:GINS complex subunit 4
MADDIQDILDSVSAPSIPQRTRDLQALTRAWVNERTALELLPYPTGVIERVMDRIKKQVRPFPSKFLEAKSD